MSKNTFTGSTIGLWFESMVSGTTLDGTHLNFTVMNVDRPLVG